MSALEIEHGFDKDDDEVHLDSDVNDHHEEISLVVPGDDTTVDPSSRGNNNNRICSYWLLFQGAAVVGTLLVVSLWIPFQHVVNTSTSHKNEAAAVSDINTTKFLERIDSLPQEDRCAQPGGSDCRCENPLQGSQPYEEHWNASWQITFQHNLQLAQEAARIRKLDLVMLGDSITEYWHGTSWARPDSRYTENANVYHELFESENSPVQGLALGIGGDRCTQLLYRLQHGEIEGLEPKVFWVLIGTNDFLGERCHADEIVAGNIRIVREILTQKPLATVVLQSLLPVGNEKEIPPNWDIYADINQRLESYARSMPQVEFANVTQLFLTPQNTVNETMLPDGLHPSGIAAAIWGEAIVEKVHDILLSG